MNLNLNAGCGASTWGSHRVDIQKFSDIYYRKKTSANIYASIEYLPFRNKVFKTSRCNHVLEHVNYPFICIMELLRVTRGRIYILVPVYHLYNFIIEAVTLVKSFMMIPFVGSTYFLDMFYKVRSWKVRYSGHKWYIKGSLINRVYFILPKEYVIILRG